MSVEETAFARPMPSFYCPLHSKLHCAAMIARDDARLTAAQSIMATIARAALLLSAMLAATGARPTGLIEMKLVAASAKRALETRQAQPIF